MYWCSCMIKEENQVAAVLDNIFRNWIGIDSAEHFVSVAFGWIWDG